MAGSGRVPPRMGTSDVRRIEEETELLRRVDYEQGGAACRDRAIVAAAWNDGTLRAAAAPGVRRRLLVALADQHNLAAWAGFDTGLVRSPERHWARARELAQEAGHRELVANVHYRVGRLRLHHRDPLGALSSFHSGLSVSSGAHTTALLTANCAWASARLGDSGEAVRCLRVARGAFDRGATPAGGWARFFDEADFSAMTGVVLTELVGGGEAGHGSEAVEALTAAVRGYSAGMARSRTFCLIALATMCLHRNDFDGAAEAGGRAVASAGAIGSSRVADRLAVVRELADRHPGEDGARRLAASIAAFVPPG
ncbi:tetratricopeptide repeat protein [Actinosynnema sp. NPDC020468]|uniref:tetratricopeptide repeat protein n=1 Tax=Actinosynnema sp. NPDC020468 TaxID=3154488 RepID=UPI0033E9699C